MQERTGYRDYRTLLRHAGLPEDEVERIASKAEEDDAKMNEADFDDHDASLEKERQAEETIRAIAEKAGLRLETNHAVMINGDEVEVVLYEGLVGPMQIVQFGNHIAASGVGHKVMVGANSSNNVVLTFTLL